MIGGVVKAVLNILKRYDEKRDMQVSSHLLCWFAKIMGSTHVRQKKCPTSRNHVYAEL
jgi:hypothetical protein